jgi:hypothetical protein
MAPKRKPITVGKSTSYSTGKRPVSAKPSQAGLVRSAQKTTSSGITKRPDGRAQSEGRSGRQSISRATVTSASNGKPSGGSARVTRGMGSQLATAAQIAKVAKGISPATVAYETLKARPTAKGTVSAGGAQGPAMPKRLQQQGLAAQEKRARQKNAARKDSSFDSAFKDARRAKVSTFTWRGKKYTTAMK